MEPPVRIMRLKETHMLDTNTTNSLLPSVTWPSQVSIPLQRGPRYHCWVCGAPATGLATWAALPKASGYSPLDAWGEHISYLTLPNCPSDHPARVAQLGRWITPLVFMERAQGQSLQQTWDTNVQAVRDALAGIAAAVPEGERAPDRTTQLVYQLLGGHITPDAAIRELRGPSGI